jgi:hypothetical protein
LGEIGENKNKRVHVFLFCLLRESHTLTDYESFKDLLCFFKVKNMAKKHWFNNLGWEMAKIIHDEVLECTKEVIKEFPFLVIFYDEITIFDIKSWISIHGYVFEN